MERKPRIPEDIIKEIGLNEPKKAEGTCTIICDLKHTGQCSIKIPARVFEEVGWKPSDKVKIMLGDKCLILKKTSGLD